MEGSLSPLERQRLASLLAAAAMLLLLVFVTAVALPLLPPRLLDPFWQLAFTGALCSNGFMALLAVVLVNLAAVLNPQAAWPASQRQLVGSLCRWVALAFLLLIPLQGLAAWRALDWAGAAESRGASQGLQRIAQFRQAVVSANSVAALQANLAAIQAPPLGPEDQRQSLAGLKRSILVQLQVAEQRARAVAGQAAGAPGALPGKALDPAKVLALGKDSLRVVLLSLGLALAFAAAAQRKGRELSVWAEWRQAVEGVLAALLRWRAAWQDNQEEERYLRQERARTQQRRQLLKVQARQERLAATRQDPSPSPSPPPPAVGQPAGPGRASGRSRRGAVDASYFESLAGEDDPPAG